MNPSTEATKLEGDGTFVQYKGVGKLNRKSVLITGGEYVSAPIFASSSTLISCLSSGIGRSIAVLMSREGADITIVYLPQEQDDAETTKKIIEDEGKSCLLIPGDLMENDLCKKAVDEHVKKLVPLLGSFHQRHCGKPKANLELQVRQARLSRQQCFQADHVPRICGDRPGQCGEHFPKQHPPDVRHHQILYPPHAERIYVSSSSTAVCATCAYQFSGS